MRRTKLVAFLFFPVLIVMLAGCTDGVGSGPKKPATSQSTQAKSAPIELNVGHVWPETEIHAQAAKRLAELVAERSAGTVKLRIYPAGQLGNDGDLIQGLTLGSVDIWIGGAGALNGIAPSARVFVVPYLFDSSDHADKVWDGPIGESIAQKIYQESRVHVIAYWPRGSRWLTVNTRVEKPEDLRGLKIRVPENPMFIKAWERFGAIPTPMAFGEVYSALQQGVIDGQENPISLIHSAKLYEVQKYLVKTEHVTEDIAVVVSDKAWNTLSDEQRQVLKDSARELRQWTAEQVASSEARLLEELQNKGMTLITVDKDAFRSRVADLVEKEFPDLKDLFAQIQNVR